MKKLRFAEEQIIFALKQAELGTYVPDVCRKLGVSDATFYLWPPTTAHCDCASVKSSKPGSTMVTAGFTSCSGGRAGGIITNAFIDSTASRVCPCISNAQAGINWHSFDSPSPSPMADIRIMSRDLCGPESALFDILPHLSAMRLLCDTGGGFPLPGDG